MILCLRPAGEENGCVSPSASEHQDQGCRIREIKVMGMESTMAMFNFVHLETKQFLLQSRKKSQSCW